MSKDVYVEFDVNDLMSYQGLVDTITRRDNFLEEGLGDPKNLIWDYDFLMTIIRTISDNYLPALQTINRFSQFWMVADFIYEATTYTLANNRTQVGQYEMLNTFKYWEYIPLNIKLDVLDDIFIQENIDYSNHPYQISKPRVKKTYQKIIPFPSIKKESNN